MWSLTNIAIGLLVVGLLLTRQPQPRLAKESSSVRLVAILAVFGVIETRNAIGAHTVPVTALAWLGLSLVAGAGMGAIRAATVRVWRAEDGSALRQGTVLTAALWLISLAVHLGLDGVIDHTSRIPLGTSSILLYLAVTLGAQREIVRWRAARLTPTTPPADRPPNPQMSSSHGGRSVPCAPCHR